MKTIIIYLLLSVLPMLTFGQNIINLNEYTICSSPLDSIIKYVQQDVNDKEIIGVSVRKDSDNDYTVFITAYSPKFLNYSNKLLGYTKRNNIIIFYLSAKDLVRKKTKNNNRIRLRCNPPPSEERPISVKGTDGAKEWTYCISGDTITLKRKILAW